MKDDPAAASASLDLTLKALSSLNNEVRPFFLSDNSIWSLPSASSLSDYSRPDNYLGGRGCLERDVWEFQAKSGSSGSCRLGERLEVPDILLPDIRGFLNFYIT